MEQVVGFLSRYSGTDQIDLGDGYNITIKRFLPGDVLERAEAVRVRAVANATTDGADKTVKIETTQDVAGYTEALLVGAVVAWNLTDEHDRLLPLDPIESKVASIRLLPADVRSKLRDAIEANTNSTVRSTEEQKTFRAAGDLSAEG